VPRTSHQLSEGLEWSSLCRVVDDRTILPNPTMTALAATSSDSLSSDPSVAIEQMVSRIATRLSPDMVVLFGSHARGYARPDSDVDLLVVMSFTGSARAAASRVYATLHDRLIPIDIVVVTMEQVQRYREQVGTIVYSAFRDGRIVYERAH
jgi:predicted nucleotidyltransferase